MQQCLYSRQHSAKGCWVLTLLIIALSCQSDLIFLACIYATTHAKLNFLNNKINADSNLSAILPPINIKLKVQ